MFDMARSNFWKHGMKEIKYFIKKIKAIKDPSAKNKFDKVVNLLAGPNSELFHAYRKISPGTSYLEFVEWIGAFYFSVHMGKITINYAKPARWILPNLPTQKSTIPFGAM